MQEKNRFQKHDEIKAVKRRNTNDVDEREERRKQQREVWISPDRAGSKSKDGFALDAATLAARQAYEQEREAKTVAAQVPAVATAQNPLSKEEEYLLARQWANSNPNWYGSEYNSQTLKTIVEAFGLPHTAAGFQKAFEYAEQHNHLEEPPVRKRSDYPAPRHAPVPFVPPTPQAQEPAHVRSGNKPVYIRQTISAEENHALREMSLEELRKQARAGMRAYGNPDQARKLR